MSKKVAADESKRFWDDVEKSAEKIRSEPDWMKAGITLNPANYTTFTKSGYAVTDSSRKKAR